MRVLYHWPLDPGSRQARIALAETKLKFKLESIDPWAPGEAFLGLTAEGLPPVLVDVVAGGKVTIVGPRAICEYVNDGSKKVQLMPENLAERAEARRLCEWFDKTLTEDVHSFIMHERVEKIMMGGQAPHPPTLREGREHLQRHLAYIKWLLERRDYLAGGSYSLADIAGMAHLSCLDFLGEIKWRDWPLVKDWYQKLKCRPAVQPLLADRLPAILPPRHYRNLDF